MPAAHPTICNDIQPWLAAQALGEADDDPQAREHLASCPRCQHDLRAYRRAAGLLLYAAPAAVPAPEVRERVIAAVARAAAHQAPGAAAGNPALRDRPRWPIFARSARAALTFAALTVALLVWNLSLVSQVNRQATQLAFHRQSWQTTIALLNDSTVKWYAVAGDHAIGHIWATPKSQEACFVAQALPALAEGQVLQVWAVQAGRRVSVGTFEPRDGNGWVLLKADAPLTSYDSVVVTVEPNGGSTAPSGPPVMSGSLAISATPSLADRQELLGALGNGRRGSN